MKLKINHVKFVTYGYHTIYLLLFQSKIIRIKEKFVAIWLYCYFGGIRIRVSACARNYSNEAALSLRVRLRGTKFASPLLAELLIKYQRLPRGFF